MELIWIQEFILHRCNNCASYLLRSVIIRRIAAGANPRQNMKFHVAMCICIFIIICVAGLSQKIILISIEKGIAKQNNTVWNCMSCVDFQTMRCKSTFQKINEVVRHECFHIRTLSGVNSFNADNYRKILNPNKKRTIASSAFSFGKDKTLYAMPRLS